MAYDALRGCPLLGGSLPVCCVSVCAYVADRLLCWGLFRVLCPVVLVRRGLGFLMFRLFGRGCFINDGIGVGGSFIWCLFHKGIGH